MRIRTDFVSNSSSSAFVVYRLGDRHICTRKQLEDFMKEALGNCHAKTYLEYVKSLSWSFLLEILAMRTRKGRKLADVMTNLKATKTKPELAEMFLELQRKAYGDFLYKKLISGMAEYTIVDRNEFLAMGKEGMKLYKKFLMLESERHCCCNDMEDQVCTWNRKVNEAIPSMDLVRDIRELGGKSFAKLLEDAHDRLTKSSDGKMRTMWDCYMSDDTDFCVLLDENVVESMEGFDVKSLDEVANDVKWVVSRRRPTNENDRKQDLDEISEIMEEASMAKYHSPSYTISRIGELIAERFGVELRNYAHDTEWITERDIVGGVHHMG